MSKIIEAKAVISAEDRTGKVLDGIARKFREVGKGAKAHAEVGRLAKQLDATQRGLKGLERFRSAQATFGQARQVFRAAQADVGRIAKELDAARKAAKAFDGIKSFSKGGAIASEIASARKQVGELERQFTTAQRAAKAASGVYEAQAAALKGAKREHIANGGSLGNLVAEQGKLKAAIEGTNAAILRQEALIRAEGRIAAGMGGPGRAAAAKIAQDRHLIDGMSAPGRQARAQQQREAEEHRANVLAQRQSQRDAYGTLAGMGGLYLGHKVKEGTQATLHTYRDFDKYKRQTQAFGNFSDPEMAKIVDMAIHGGASTRYNDIQWLQGAKALGGRGVKAGSVMSILPEAAQFGQAMSTDLPEAVAGLEGSLFAFRRDLSTPEAARAAARRTADLQVGAAKAFGLSHHDLKGGYEYGALGAEMTGLGEEKLLAFLGLGKKLNIDGITQGNAWRAMTSKYLSPTRKGREALAGVGVDYSKYQQMPDKLSVDNFANMIAQQYGVKLDKGARGKLDTAFSDKNTFGNASAFAVAVKDALKGQVGISGAKDANKVAGSAERFRQTNVEKVDVNGLFDALMEKIQGGNLALANAIFGEKQGNRIMAALRDKDVWNESLKKVQQTPDGKAQDVADKMNAGFDGAVARFEGAIKNLETAAGRSWDDDGKGGFLTGLADAAARATQALAELPKPALQAGSAAAWLGGKAATASGTIALVGAAFSLKGAASALMAAATRLGVGGAIGAGGNAVGGAAAGAAGSAAAGAAGGAAAGRAGSLLATTGVVGGVAAGGLLASVFAKRVTEDEGFAKAYLDNPMLSADPAGYGLAAAIMNASKLGPRKGSLPPGTAGMPTPMPARPPGLDGRPAMNRAAAEQELAGFTAALAAAKSELGGLLATGEGAFSPDRAGLEAKIADLSAKIDASGQRAALNNTLDQAANNSATRANGGQPITAEVKPDQLVAKVDSLPPITGQAEVNVTTQVNATVTLNEPMLNAKIEAAAGRAAAKMPLSSAGRAGATSMPGAAATPGAAGPPSP